MLQEMIVAYVCDDPGFAGRNQELRKERTRKGRELVERRERRDKNKTGWKKHPSKRKSEVSIVSVTETTIRSEVAINISVSHRLLTHFSTGRYASSPRIHQMPG
jgi:hypothetical protein